MPTNDPIEDSKIKSPPPIPSIPFITLNSVLISHREKKPTNKPAKEILS